MSWRHSIALVVLSVLAGLPIAGTVCAIGCEPASKTASAHHGTGCEEPAGPATGGRIGAASAHDCVPHDAAVRPVIAMTVKRSNTVAISAPVALGMVQTNFEALTGRQSFFDSASPPGTAPPATTALVLRI